MSGDALRRLIVAAGAVAALGGCGLGPGERPDSPVGLSVTRDFGARPVVQERDAKVSGADTVMRVTQRNAKVTTRFGGDFVHAIAGISGGHAGGRPVDWFIYVNGILTDRGAGGLRVAGGDRLWWDHHEWGLTPDVPAVVGSFPEPFRHGAAGRTPVKVQCELPRAAPCDTVVARLERAGVRVRRGALRRTARDASLRVLVGAWPALRDGTPEARSIEQGPKSSGVFARFADGGRALALLDPRGAVAKRLTAQSGLVAATRQPGRPPVWFVTGTDAPGVAAAARALDEPVLRNHFALATAGGLPLRVPLPEAAG
ncbi:MAG: DUF4430 domain-containing protein [Solirubrobacteraceae bacterium]|nr:DUF4430 domain-containing protein [Solirubrobacteraceae bacterium]